MASNNLTQIYINSTFCMEVSTYEKLPMSQKNVHQQSWRWVSQLPWQKHHLKDSLTAECQKIFPQITLWKVQVPRRSISWFRLQTWFSPALWWGNGYAFFWRLNQTMTEQSCPMFHHKINQATTPLSPGKRKPLQAYFRQLYGEGQKMAKKLSKNSQTCMISGLLKEEKNAPPSASF